MGRQDRPGRPAHPRRDSTSGAAPALGWPLVDRRRRSGSAPDGQERRGTHAALELERLAEANRLLASLHQALQQLPASLDLDDVLDAAVQQVRDTVGARDAAIALWDAEDGELRIVRSTVARRSATTTVPTALTQALVSSASPLLVPDVSAVGGGVLGDTGAALHAPALVGDRLIGVLMAQADTFAVEHTMVLGSVAASFAVAVDNARLMRRVHLAGADDERRRLAREIHDRLGSGLALIGFELDGIAASAVDGMVPVERLGTLRLQLSGLMSETREALADLRADVTEANDLAATLSTFLRRFESRSGIRAALDASIAERLPTPVQREIWQIAREALVNVERHSGASSVRVCLRIDDDVAELTVQDDGRGLERMAARADSYGLTGMRERAAAIGARIHVSGGPDRGTTVTVRRPAPGRASGRGAT